MSTVFRNRWLEVAMPCHSWGSLTLSNYHEHESLCVSLLRLGLYFKIPKFLRGEVMEEAYGAYLGDDALVLEWGRKRLFLHYPWAFEFHSRYEMVRSTRYGAPVDSWVKVEDMGDPLMRAQRRNYLPHGEIAHKETHPYRYVLRGGEVQERQATIYAMRYEHRRRWLPFTRLFAKVSESISVDFDDEVGERSGSWKGGCTGCGYDLLPGETPLQSLRRMESERRFT